MFEIKNKAPKTSTNALLEKRLKRTEQQIRAILDLNHSLASTRKPDDLLRLIIAKVTELMEAERATLFRLDPKEKCLVSKIFQGEEMTEIRLPLGQGIAGWVAQSGEVVNILNAYEDPRFDKRIDQRTGYLTRSILTAALSTPQGQRIGVLQVLNKREGHPFNEEDELLLTSIAAQCAIFLENVDLYTELFEKNREISATSEELKQRNVELDILLSIEKQMTGIFDPQEMLSTSLKTMVSLLSCETGVIGLFERERDTLKVQCVQGRLAQEINHQCACHDESFLAWSARHGEALLSNRPQEDPRFKRDIAKAVCFSIRSVLSVPLAYEEQTIGAIELINKLDPAGFSESDKRIVSLIASSISRAIALDRQRLQKERQGRLATIGKLLSGIIHDLKTPLSLISGYAQMMAEDPEPPKREDFLQIILRQVDRIGQMTREVLAFARGDSTLLIRKVHMNQFIKDLEQHLLQEFRPYLVRLELHADYTGDAYFDEIKIQRLLYNLARNARQAMPDGGTFVLSFKKSGDRLLLEAKDTGQGIPQELQAHIFESFVTGRPSKGTGLGLAIVKNIVQEHQGEITFQSRPREGTSFLVSLPLQGPRMTAVSENGEPSLAAAPSPSSVSPSPSASASLA